MPDGTLTAVIGYHTTRPQSSTISRTLCRDLHQRLGHHNRGRGSVCCAGPPNPRKGGTHFGTLTQHFAGGLSFAHRNKMLGVGTPGAVAILKSGTERCAETSHSHTPGQPHYARIIGPDGRGIDIGHSLPLTRN